MRHVLLLLADIVGFKMAGPAIRYWNFAQELKATCKVTLLTEGPTDPAFVATAPFPIEQLTNATLAAALEQADMVVLHGGILSRHPSIKKGKAAVIVDLYDPFILENLEMRKAQPMRDQIFCHEYDLNVILDQLISADHVLCASEKQRDFWLGMLAAMNRLNPPNYALDSSLNSLISVVPFGITNTPPVKTKPVLRGVMPGIEPDDFVMIWGGGIWNWFDPLTLIRGLHKARETRTDLKLFFLGVKHPNPEIPEMHMLTETYKLCDELGMRDTSVFLHSGWVPYDERHNYLMEADIGVSTHFSHLETRYAFRTRILDYIWCGLPMLLTEGDILAEACERRDLGITVPHGDVDAVAAAILKLAADQDARRRHQENLTTMRAELLWREVTKPLIKFCCEGERKTDQGQVHITGSISANQQRWLNLRRLMTRNILRRALGKIKRSIFPPKPPTP